MRRRAVVAACASAAVAATLALALARDRPTEPTVPPRVQAPPEPGARHGARRGEQATRDESALPSGPVGARVVRRTQLRSTPGGRVVRAIDTTTGYGSPRVLAVVARRGDWLAVLSDHMPNSRAAWIPQSSAELVHEPYRLVVDLSARRLTVLREGRVARRIRVAIGKPATSTPTGRFAVTDTLRIGAANPQYGCCAVALTGRQPNLPQGWSTSDRLAIHGTPNERAIGGAVSHGCLHAREADMRWLLRHVTLGAQVQIRA